MTIERLTCSTAAYHRDFSAVSHSTLEVFRRSPVLYHWLTTGRYIPAPKTEYDIGTVFHDLVLGNQSLITWESFAKLRTVAMWKPCERPNRFPDHESPSASYWTHTGGVVRQSATWGRVGASYWAIPAGSTIGYCPFSYFLTSDTFLPIPPDVLASNGAKTGKSWKEFEEANAGKILLKEKEFEPLAEMVASLKSHDFARKILYESSGENELKLRWTDPELGIDRRCMIDALRLPDGNEFGIIADVKTVGRFPTPQQFSRIAWELGYHRQQEYYRDAVHELCGQRLPFVFIAVLKVPPYTCRCFELSQKFSDMGRLENKVDLKALAVRRANNAWEDADWGECLTIEPPNFAEYQSNWEFSEP